MHFGRYASRKSEAKYPSLWDGLVGAWCPSVQNASGNTLYDLSERNNHGTLTNMDPATDWVRGDGRGALDFDGGNDFVSVNYPQPPLITVSVFFLRRGSPAAAAIVNNRNGGNDAGWTINDGTCFFRIAGAWRSVTLTTPTASLGHVCVTFNGQDLIGYSNASVTSSLSVTGSVDYTSGMVGMIGSANVGGNGTLDGLIDDVLIYNRALSPAEIRLLASQRGIAFTPKRRSIFRQLTNRLRSSRFAAFPA